MEDEGRNLMSSQVQTDGPRQDGLKPCPFCGEVEHLYPAYRWPGTGSPYAVDCLRCGYDFTPRDGMDVVAMWNKRHTPDASLQGGRE